MLISFSTLKGGVGKTTNIIMLATEVPRVLFRLSRLENLDHTQEV